MTGKQVIILGGGFAGVACAKAFARDYPDFDVTVIDQSPTHVIHGNLYEVATSPQELFDLKDLKQTVAIPFSKIFHGTKIKFKQGRVTGVDLQNHRINIDSNVINYDYLVSALGSGANFYGIAGVQEHAIPLQSAGDALRIRDKIEFAVQSNRVNVQKDVVRIVVAGGGVAGIEIAAELQGMLDFVAWKNSYPREKIKTVVIEGTAQILPGFDSRAVVDATDRLQFLGVEIITHRMISSVEDSLVSFSNGEKMEYDCLIWTAGVKATSLQSNPAPLVAKGDRVEVDDVFCIKRHPGAFVIGDQSCHHDPQGNPLPGTASQAIDHGHYVAKAINAISKNLQPPPHMCKSYPMLIPLGGRWAIFKGNRLYFKGYLGYLIREFVWLRYYASLFGWEQALRMSFRNEKVYDTNDI